MFHNLYIGVIIKKRKDKKHKNIPCWKYFNCPEKYRKKCRVYLNHEGESTICYGPIYFETNKGGPAKRGPCIKCEIFKKSFPELYSLFKE